MYTKVKYGKMPKKVIRYMCKDLGTYECMLIVEINRKTL